MRPLFLLFFVSVLGLSGEVRARDVVEGELRQQRQRLESLRQEMVERRAKTSQIKASERTVLEDLAELDRRIREQWDRLEATKKAWTQKELALLETQESYREREKALERLEVPLERRLRTFYQLGTVGTLNVLFAAKSLSELRSRETYLRHLLSRDRQERTRYREHLSELKAVEARLERERRALSWASEEIEDQALALEERKREKEAFLRELCQQGQRYEVLLSELQAAAIALEAVIERLSQETRARETATDLDKDLSFSEQKGKLLPPVRGKVLKLAGRRVRGEGLVLSAPLGNEIRAIFDGRVVFLDVLTGYGKVLVLDHGNHYYSLVAQAVNFFKAVGDEVREGEILGLVGGGPWVPEGIYFEIRHGVEPEDPLAWLDQRMLDTEG